MNLDVYKKTMLKESPSPKADARILAKLQAVEQAQFENTRPKAATFSRLRPLRLATLALCFVLLSFGTLTATGKILHDDWLALFKTLETKSVEAPDDWNSAYQQIIGESRTQNGLTLTLEKIYFDGKILFTESVIRAEEGGDIFKDPELAEKYQKSMNLVFHPNLLFDSRGDYGYYSTGKRTDDGSNPKEIRLASHSVISNEPLDAKQIAVIFSGLSFRSAGQVNLEENPYYLFGDGIWYEESKTPTIRFDIDLNSFHNNTEIEKEEGLGIRYSDLSLSLDYDTKKLDLPKWYQDERSILGEGKGYGSVGASMNLAVKVNYLDGRSQNFEAIAHYSEAFYSDGSEAASASYETVETAISLEEVAKIMDNISPDADADADADTDPNQARVDKLTESNQEYFRITIPFPDVLNSAEIESFEIQGEVYKVK